MTAEVYENKGPPWRRASGEVVPHGGLFTPTQRELWRMQQRRQTERRFVKVSDGPTLVLPADGPPNPPIAPEPEWPLRMPPEQYVERYPSGRHAALARRVLAERTA